MTVYEITEQLVRIQDHMVEKEIERYNLVKPRGFYYVDHVIDLFDQILEWIGYEDIEESSESTEAIDYMSLVCEACFYRFAAEDNKENRKIVHRMHCPNCGNQTIRYKV